MELWGSINVSDWKNTPYIIGRTASENDIEKGLAVFSIGQASTISPVDLDLPLCGVVYEEDDEGNEAKTPVIVIQAEKADETIYIGYRNLNGGNGVCLSGEIELLEEPNELFFSTQTQ